MDCPIISNEIAVDVKQTKRTQRQTQTIFAARLWRKTESKNSDGDVDEGPDPLPPRRITYPSDKGGAPKSPIRGTDSDRWALEYRAPDTLGTSSRVAGEKSEFVNSFSIPPNTRHPAEVYRTQHSRQTDNQT